MHPLRSLLFAPGNHPRKVAKVFDAGADGVILDLEDAVAVAEKPATRAVVTEALQRPRSCRGYVRVNASDTPFCFGDLMAVVGPGLDGVILPKVESPAQLQTIDWVLTQLERERGLPERGIELIPIIETGRAIADLRAIARSGTRVRRLSFGAGDYTLDVGITWSMDETELAQARAEVVVQSRAAGLEPPLDTVFIHIGEAHAQALERSATTAKNMGFAGKLCIHPGQVEPINRVFRPTTDEVARARKIVAAFEAAEAAGSASIQVDGYFVDYPIVETARRALALEDALQKPSGP